MGEILTLLGEVPVETIANKVMIEVGDSETMRFLFGHLAFSAKCILQGDAALDPTTAEACLDLIVARVP